MDTNDDIAKAAATVTQLAFSIPAGHAFGAGIQLGFADMIADGTLTSSEIATRSGTQPQATRRLLRTWAALGLLEEPEPDRFALTVAGRLLRSDGRRSAQVTARMFTHPLITDAWRSLDRSIETGRTSFDETFGTDFFSYIGQQPAVAEMFHAAMGQGTSRVAPVIAREYDLSRFRHVVDIGGGDGTLVTALLRQRDTLRGTVFDTPDGAASTEEMLRDNGLTDRCDVVFGDFFASVPSGGDLYFVKSVLHDWSDEHCGTVLGNIRRVIPDDGRLLIVETVLPDTVDGSIPPYMYLSDLNMLVNLGGRERTRAEFDELCRASGFTVTDVRSGPDMMGFSLIEAVPA